MKKLLIIIALFSLPSVAFAYDVTTTASTDGGAGTFGYSTTGSEFQAQPFTTVGAGDVTQITFNARVTGGAPSDDVQVTIQADNAGSPSNTPLVTSTAADVSGGTCTDYTVTFSATALSASTQYWFVLGRTGALSTSDFYGACGNVSSGGAKQSDNPSTSWVATSVTIRGVITITEAAASVASSILGLVRAFWIF